MDEWLSEGVQVGGVASAIGVLGLWTGAQHERMDPLGAYPSRYTRLKLYTDAYSRPNMVLESRLNRSVWHGYDWEGPVVALANSHCALPLLSVRRLGGIRRSVFCFPVVVAEDKAALVCAIRLKEVNMYTNHHATHIHLPDGAITHTSTSYGIPD